MQFHVIGWDGTDADAPARRQAARDAHLAGLRALRKDGHILMGGPLLDGDRMIGSALFAEFPDRAALDAWLAREPYVLEKVWQKVEVRLIRIVNLD